VSPACPPGKLRARIRQSCRQQTVSPVSQAALHVFTKGNDVLPWQFQSVNMRLLPTARQQTAPPTSSCLGVSHPGWSDATSCQFFSDNPTVARRTPLERAIARLAARRWDRKLRALHLHPLLAPLKRRDILQLGSYADCLFVPAGAQIVARGSRATFCYFFHAGEVVGATGGWTLPGDAIVVGLHSALASSPHPESVVAGSDLHGYVMDARYADWLVSRNAGLLHTPCV
jgi:hypothetical protein